MLEYLVSSESQLVGLKVKVYRNLHKNCLSVQHRGRVIAHVEMITLGNVTFKVNEAGRQRVLRERKKNVHAFVQGTVTGTGMQHWAEKNEHWTKVSYNPYKAPTFTLSDGTPVLEAQGATVTTRGTLI